MTEVCSPQAFHILVGGLMIETGIYGLYAALVAVSTYLLADAQSNKMLYMATTIAMFILCSGTLLMDLTRTFLGRESLFYTAACVDGICPPCRWVTATPEGLFGEAVVAGYLTILSAVMLIMNQVIADGVLIFRCYILWDARRWVVIPPLVGLLGNIACMLGSLCYEIRLFNIIRDSDPLVIASHQSPPVLLLEKLVEKLDIAHVVLSLTTNVLASAIIVTPIWRKAKQSDGIAYKKYFSAVTICLETGSLLSFALIALLIMALTVPRFVIVPTVLAQQFVGIAPTLIIVRVGLGRSVDTQPTCENGANQPPLCTLIQRKATAAFAEYSDDVEQNPGRFRCVPCSGEVVMDDGLLTPSEFRPNDRKPCFRNGRLQSNAVDQSNLSRMAILQPFRVSVFVTLWYLPLSSPYPLSSRLEEIHSLGAENDRSVQPASVLYASGRPYDRNWRLWSAPHPESSYQYSRHVEGLYIALVAGSTYLLTDAQSNRMLYLGTTMAMFILCSGVLMLDLTRVLLTRESLFYTAACVEDICPPCKWVVATPRGLVDEAIISCYLTILTAVMLMMNQVIADGVLIFRCYILWGARKWVVIPPLVGLLGNIACMLGSLYYEIRLFSFLRDSDPLVITSHDSPIMFELGSLVESLDVAHVVLSLATNILASAIIITPIWRKAKQSHGITYRKYLSAVTICLETGSLLSVVLIMLLIMALTVPRFVIPTEHSLLIQQIVPTVLSQQFIGIAPTLIIVRVGLGRSVDAQPTCENEALHPPLCTLIQSKAAVAFRAPEYSDDAVLQSPE
ncbi:hypothetical protein EVG20_g8923 [Dentipellis fragilis]|uniref:Uncharacterized protein n=1 Tax=Dentipellis fragilis TaxID=205917 RepID=A0A4Y9Y240_9AGAM|nr:hypothetical protein EVG20_g8923 [Dentipellis fragilis]